MMFLFIQNSKIIIELNGALGNPSQIGDTSNVTPKHRNGGEDSSSSSLSFGRSSGGGVAPKRREDAFPVPADDEEESVDAASAADADGARLLLMRRRRQQQQQRRLGSRTAARSYGASDDGEAASAAIGPLLSRRLGIARATSSPKPSQYNNNNSDNDNKRSLDCSSSTFPLEGERHSKNPSPVLSRGRRDFASERSKSDLCHADKRRDLVYRSSIRIMVRPEHGAHLVIQRSASENRVSNGSNGDEGVPRGGGDEVSANGASNADVGGKKKSRKESIGLIQKSVAKDNVR